MSVSFISRTLHSIGENHTYSLGKTELQGLAQITSGSFLILSLPLVPSRERNYYWIQAIASIQQGAKKFVPGTALFLTAYMIEIGIRPNLRETS